MKYLRAAMLCALLAQAPHAFAATQSINIKGSITSENSCAIETSNQNLDLGKHHYKNLNADVPTSLPFAEFGGVSSVTVNCMRETPLALKFSTTGSRPMIDGTYHSITLGEVGTSIKKTVAYADITAGLINRAHVVLSGHLTDPLVLPAGLPVHGVGTEIALHGDPASPSEPERSGMTFVNADGTLARGKEFKTYLGIKVYATATNNWADSMPEASDLQLRGSFTVTAVYL
jgi:hypothetical protein